MGARGAPRPLRAPVKAGPTAEGSGWGQLRPLKKEAPSPFRCLGLPRSLPRPFGVVRGLQSPPWPPEATPAGKWFPAPRGAAGGLFPPLDGREERCSPGLIGVCASARYRGSAWALGCARSGCVRLPLPLRHRCGECSHQLHVLAPQKFKFGWCRDWCRLEFAAARRSSEAQGAPIWVEFRFILSFLLLRIGELRRE